MPEKILIVDDDIDSLKLIGLMLQRQGYEVNAATAGQQAITKAIAERPDLIILDIMMPDMNGYEVCRHLRSNPETQAIPIIMFTAKTLIDDKVAGFEAGADDYLTKPTHPAELASRVRAVLARNNHVRVRPTSNERHFSIGLIGAKGGVGTSTLALNLAAALLQIGEQPILADFRLGAGSTSLALNLRTSPNMASLLKHAPDDIQYQTVKDHIITHESGLRTLLSSANPNDAQLNYAPETAFAVMNQLRALGNPVVVDLGSTMTPTIAQLQRDMDLILMVVEPLSVTLSMARQLLPHLVGNNAERVHIAVVNRAQSGMQIPWHEIEKILGHEIRAIISSAPDLSFQAMQAGTPMVFYQPSAIVSTQIIKLAENLNSRIHAQLSGKFDT